MSEFAIQVEGLGKRYKIGKPASHKNGSASPIKKLLSPFEYLISTLREPDPEELIWALKNVSFDVERGEVVGIVGHNGAGKSTLLKILSRITEPTQGQALIKGRVGSLLEVGTGFHHELTGRENIYLSGTIMGMKRDEIQAKFDEIVDFAGVEKFLDTQVKRYSSGMYVRLAFAVAAHLEPEILLVDEVLAVGDAAFQKKCLGKMGDVASQGRTVLFVSHNMVAVQNLCRRALWIHQGGIEKEGPTNDVIKYYLTESFSSQSEQIWVDKARAPGNELVRLHRVAIRPQYGAADEPISMSTPIEVEVEFWNLKPDERLHLCLHVYTEQNIIAFTSSSNETDEATRDKPLSAGLYRSVCHIPADLFNSGVHRIQVLILRNGLRIIHREEDALSFEIVESGDRAGAWYGKEPGVIHPKLNWHTKLMEL